MDAFGSSDNVAVVFIHLLGASVVLCLSYNITKSLEEEAKAAKEVAEAKTSAAAEDVSNQCHDASVRGQLNFQTPATSIMEKIVDLHHDLMFFIVVIVIFVS